MEIELTGMADSSKTKASPPIWSSVLLMSLFAILGIIGLFHFKESLGVYFWIAYLFILPVLLYGLSVGFSLMAQKQSCGSMNIKMAISGSIYMLVYVYAAIGLTQFAVIRAPVVSVVPYSVQTVKGIEDVLEIEKALPLVHGIAISYYFIFAIILGQMSSLGYSAVCASS